MKAVIDASVVVKWFLPDAAVEPDSAKALLLLKHIRDGDVEPLQPPHWLAEVAAVIARLKPEIAEDAIDLLDAMEFPIISEPAIYERAVVIASGLGQHLFDTLYHALALERSATLISADHRYCAKAASLGHVIRLTDWESAELG